MSSQLESKGGTAQHSGQEGPSRDAVFTVLSNARRRHVLRALREEDGSIELGPLAEQVAAWENETTVREITYDQRKRTYTALQQSHLPKMDEAGALEFDKGRGTVEPAEDMSEFDVYLEVVPGTALPRSEYYVGLGAVAVGLSSVVAVGIGPFGLVHALWWATIAVGLFGVSALVHLYATRRSNLQAYATEQEE